MPIKYLCEPGSSLLRSIDKGWLAILEERIMDSPVAHIGPMIVNVIGWDSAFQNPDTIGSLDLIDNRKRFLQRLNEV